MDFRITITGNPGVGLLMHNARLANPLDPAAKELKTATGKRTKTDADYELVARLEFAGSLYFDSAAGPYIPADNIFRCMWDAAKKTKEGPKIKEGLFIRSDVNPLMYRGPRTIEELWADESFRHLASAKVTTTRVMRCRPIFVDWVTEAEGIIDETIIDLATLKKIADTAGERIGLCDWRPRYGRFTATITKI